MNTSYHYISTGKCALRILKCLMPSSCMVHVILFLRWHIACILRLNTIASYIPRNEQYQEDLWRRSIDMIKDYLSPEILATYGPPSSPPVEDEAESQQTPVSLLRVLHSISADIIVIINPAGNPSGDGQWSYFLCTGVPNALLLCIGSIIRSSNVNMVFIYSDSYL